jgi:hypothetical protein
MIHPTYKVSIDAKVLVVATGTGQRAFSFAKMLLCD